MRFSLQLEGEVEAKALHTSSAVERERRQGREAPALFLKLFFCMRDSSFASLSTIDDEKKKHSLSPPPSPPKIQVTSSPRPWATRMLRPRTRPWTLCSRGRRQPATGRWRSELMTSFFQKEKREATSTTEEKRTRERESSSRAFPSSSTSESVSVSCWGERVESSLLPCTRDAKKMKETRRKQAPSCPVSSPCSRLSLSPSLSLSLSLSRRPRRLF